MSVGVSADSALYPPIEPFKSEYLQVSEVHSIYFEQCGNINGLPVLFVHGGPGAGTSPRDRRYFDPEMYHIILYDQRGSGKSIPESCTDENDTWILVKDMEKLREYLGVDRWILFGGSWGSTLSLAYAETHISRVLGLIISGVFTFRPEETRWLYQEGASIVFPDHFEKYVEPIPLEERNDLFKAYYKRMTTGSEEGKVKYAKSFNCWEVAVSRLRVNVEGIKKIEEDPTGFISSSLICLHYFVNDGFFHTPSQLLDNASIIAKSGIPVFIIQGRYDMICPVKTAWALHKKIPNSELHLIEDAGHSSKEIGTTVKAVEICDKLKNLIKK